MKENKNKGLRRGGSGRFYPLAPWKKFVSWLMVGLTVTWIVPPNVVAAEIAEHQNAKAVEQAKRDARTRVRTDIPIARQNAENIRILRKTCREIERKLAAKESIDSEMKDIDQLYAHLTSIRTTALKQMDAQRAKMVEKKVKQEMLDRVDQARQEYLKRIDPYFNKVKAISENKSKPEILKKAISDLEVYLVECEKQNQPKSKESKDTAALPRRSTSATHVPPIYSSIPHNGIVLASADDTIGDWLKEAGDIAVSGETTPADLAATPEIVIDDEIRALAQLLENHPVRIYEYVRNNFVYEPYWGSQKGTKRTLLEKAGNDIDLASLTMALLRAAGINCRYVCGTIELTCKEAGKWIGVDDPAQIVRTFQANGIPFETTTSAGQVSKIRLNHTWITAYVDYFPYHGTRNEVPNTWIEIDPSFKQNTFTTKNDLQTTIGINPDTLLVNVKAQSATDAAGTFAAGVPEAFILSEIFSYQEPIRSYLAANDLTTENVFRQRKVNEEKFGLFPVTDNYKIISRGLSFNTLPDSLSGTVTLTLKNENNNTAFTHTTPLSMLADSRITLSYKPATEDDLAIITENAASSAFPVYMVNLIPELKIDDTIVGTGTAVGMGRKQLLEVTFNVPGFEPVVSSSNITVGSFSVLVPDFQNITADEINRQQSKLAALAKTPSVSRDVMLGESLRGLGLNYWHQLDRFNQVTAGNLGVAITRVPSMIRVAWDLNVADQLGLPFSASVDRIKLNIIRDYNVPIAINQEKLAGEKQFAFTSALTGTALEHNVLAQPFAGEAASAARVIQKANSSKKADGTDMKIFTVTAANINEILPNLDLPSSMVADIRNAVNANIEVTVPEGAVNLNGVDYYAYVKRDIATSASEFFLDSRGGELVNNTLTALDLLTDGSAEAYNKVAQPLADWLEVAVDSTTNAGLAYLPAITALNSWYAKRTELDPVTTVAAIIAVSGPITRVYNQPAILNVTTNDKLISPNGDGVKDSFTLKANVTRNAAWKFEILNPQNQSVIVEENNTPIIDINFDQNIPDGVYTYRITASADGVNADPVSGTFKVDCTPPVANFTIVPPARPDIYSPSLNLRGTADDPNFDHVVITAQTSGADAMEVYRSNDITISSILTAIDSTKFANGPLHILMTVTDKAGNVSTCSVVHNVNNPEPDLLPPTVQLAVKNGETAVTSGATVDADSGFLTYSISANDNIAVTKINLLLDGQVYASGNNVSELNNSVLTMTLRDGAHTLQAEAYDAAGNKAQTAILDFSLTSPVSNFRVTPDTARPGTSTITITANIRQAADWTLSFAGTSAGTSQIAPISGNGTVVATLNPADYADGQYKVTLTVNGKTPELPFNIYMTQNAPIARFGNLTLSADGVIPVVQDGLFNLIGTADDPDLGDTVKYKLELLKEVDGYDTFLKTVTPEAEDAQGWKTGRVIDDSFGDIDFTTLSNSIYKLRLTVVDDTGKSASDEVTFALNSELKIGQMKFSQQDLVIPVNGQPISVIRSYDSFNSEKQGDFGYGWTYSLKDIEVEFTEQRSNIYDDNRQLLSLRTGGSRDVTITLPNGKRTTFRYRLQAVGWPFQSYKAFWDATPGVYATLVPTCSNEIVALPGGIQYWQASGPTTAMDNFDIPGFILTLKDGTKYEIAREDLGFREINEYAGWTAQGNYVQAYGKATLRQITDNNGNSLVFSEDGIQSYNASGEKTKSIVFDRNDAGNIIAIYAPSSLNEDGTKPENAIPQFKYIYDAAGNLSEVHKLIDRTKPVDQQYAVTKYLYEEPERPHFVTKIVDPLGNAPMKCIYDTDGRLIATEDANGNRIEMQHDLSGRTETITDRMGNPTIHTFDDRGNVTATIDALGNATKYSYDSLGNKLSETNALGYTTSYTYDSRGNQTSVTDPLGNVTRYEYDGKGNEIKTVDALGNITLSNYDSANNPILITDALGNSSSLTYSSEGNMTSISDVNGNIKATFSYGNNGNPVAITDNLGITRNYFYNTDGYSLGESFVWTENGSSKEMKTQIFYNDAAQIVKNIDEEGNSFTSEYNSAGRVIRTTNAQGNITEKKYDIIGNVIETKNPDGSILRTVYDSNGRLYVTQDAHVLGEAATGSRLIYNSVGQVIRTEYLENVVIDIVNNTSRFTRGDVISFTSKEYDAVGNVIRQTDGYGNTIRYEYDAAGRNIAVIDALNHRTEFTYDANGCQTSMKDPQGNIVSYEYDALGRKTKTIFPDGTFATVKYNNLGQKIEETDAAGLVTKFEYDQAERLTAVVKTEVNGEVPRWEYTYNQYGQRTSIKDPKGKVTNFTYDYAGRQLSRTLPMGQKETAEFNRYGQLAKQTDFKGQMVEVIYDTLGRKIAQKYYAAGSTTSAEEIRFTYDGTGRLQTVVQDGVEISEDGTLLPSLRETAYAYNSRGELTQISTPEGSVNYEYDAKTGAKTRVYTANSDVRYTYDALNRLKTVAVYMRNGVALATPEVTTYDYTKIGSRASVVLPNGVTTNYQYDNLNRLTQLIHEKDGVPIASYSYELLPTGHRAAVTEVTPEGSSEIHYTYDNLYRLTKEVRTGVKSFEASYAYDINSNRTQKVIAGVDENDTINYAYNANDQLTSEVSSANGTTVYTYDANGSLTTKINAGQSINCQYGYDLRNRLVSANITRMEGTAPNQPQKVDIVSRYAYNADGIRTRALQTINGVTQNRYFLLDNGHTGYSQVFEETSSLGGNVVRSYVIGDDVLSQTVGSMTSHLLYDGHGSTRQLANSNDEITDSYAYDAYGKMLGGDPNVSDRKSTTDLLYAGEQFDAGLQMEYLRARYYNATTGRFNQLDPFDGNSDDPQSLHKYAYAHCDPVNGIDPSGLYMAALLGQKVHADWEARIKAKYAGFDVRTEQSIMTISGQIIRPDIIHVSFSEVYEIKPLSKYGLKGQAQLAGYIAELNLLKYEGRIYRNGLMYTPVSGAVYPIPGTPGFSYITLYNSFGVLFYKILTPKTKPGFLSKEVKNEVKDDVKNKIDELKYEPVMLNQYFDTTSTLYSIGALATWGILASAAYMQYRSLLLI